MRWFGKKRGHRQPFVRRLSPPRVSWAQEARVQKLFDFGFGQRTEFDLLPGYDHFLAHGILGRFLYLS